MNQPFRILLTCLVAASVVTVAKGGAILTFNDGIDPVISIADNGVGDMSSATGLIEAQASLGVWVLSISTSITKPIFGSSGDPMMDINVQADSVGAGTLQLTFSDNGFGPATGTLNAVITGQLVVGAPSTLGYNVYGDPGNIAGAQTVLLTSTGTVGLSIPGEANASGPLTLGAPYSLTQVLTFTSTGPAEVNADGAFTVAVPEPGVLSLATLGLVAFVLKRRVSRKAL